MKAHVDLSIFASPTESFGMASGELEFETLPRQGELVTLGRPIEQTTPLPNLGRFSFQLRVEHVIHVPLGASGSVIVLLETAVLQSRPQAEALSTYLEQGFGLHVDVF